MKDEEIVRLYNSRSEEAIKETDRAYGPYFRSVARTVLEDEEDAKEVINDAYLKAWNSIPPEQPRSLKAFISRIVRQTAINRLEERSAQKRGGGNYALVLGELSECIPDTDGGEDIADKTALRDLLNVFLRALPKEQRRVFILRYWHMRRIKEIAKDLGMSESKVKSMLMRIRKTLGAKLKEEGFTL